MTINLTQFLKWSHISSFEIVWSFELKRDRFIIWNLVFVIRSMGKKEYLRILKSFKRIVKKIWIDKATAFGFKRSYDFKQRSETSIPDLIQINGHYLYDLSQWDIQELTFKDLRFTSNSHFSINDRTMRSVHTIYLHSAIQVHPVKTQTYPICYICIDFIAHFGAVFNVCSFQ